MPFTWNKTQPSPTQNISAGQGTILNNFSFLGDTTGNTSPYGYYKLPNSLIINWGKASYNAGTWTTSGANFVSPIQTFALAYVNPPYSIVLGLQVGDTESKRFVIFDVAPGAAPSNIGFYLGSSTKSFDVIYWLAIGV